MKHPKMEFKLITTFLLWFFSLFFIYSRYTNCRILRLPCQHFANFTVTRKGYALLLAQISVYDHLSVQECKAQCVFNQNCKAVSYNVNGTCILNSEAPADPLSTIFEGNLTQEMGWSFMSTNYSEKLVGHICQKHQPCGEKFCMDSCECPGYQCISCGADATVECPDGHTFVMKNGKVCLTYINDVFRRTKDCTQKFFFETGKDGLFLKHTQTNMCVGLKEEEGKLLAKKCGTLDTIWRRSGASILWNAATNNCLFNHLPWVYESTKRELAECYKHNNTMSIVYDSKNNQLE
ncbi:uncharacterized protein LOC135691439 isoform X2 [Rhopilema esculentum]|uniref:uncharacterized protein LOC135691439 isoform X2 n=1 Tax=Rhopilema esculentum TaxID=499914 RepID=UPI0031DE290C